jgi:hypothetical protein
MADEDNRLQAEAGPQLRAAAERALRAGQRAEKAGRLARAAQRSAAASVDKSADSQDRTAKAFEEAAEHGNPHREDCREHAARTANSHRRTAGWLSSCDEKAQTDRMDEHILLAVAK